MDLKFDKPLLAPERIDGSEALPIESSTFESSIKCADLVVTSTVRADLWDRHATEHPENLREDERGVRYLLGTYSVQDESGAQEGGELRVYREVTGG